MDEFDILNGSSKQLYSLSSYQALRTERLKFHNLQVEGRTPDQLLAAKARIIDAKQRFMNEAGWHPNAKGIAQRLAPW